MHIITTVHELRTWRQQAGHVAFVPTMGNLHDGHIALCQRAWQELQQRHWADSGQIIASIFVNPLQFGPQEDLDKYPRTFATDCDKLQAAGVHAVFHPSVQELYPYGSQQYFVEPPDLQNQYCGAFRPGHFRGVTTVVVKLFNLVQPHIAVFGKKDYQQLAIIRGMVADLNMPIEIIGHDTQRAADGLALSSRNGYLSPTERTQAVRLHQTLLDVQSQLLAGMRDWSTLEQHATQALNAHGWRTDYIRIVDRVNLQTPRPDSTELVILAASYLGNTRLIDNLEVTL